MSIKIISVEEAASLVKDNSVLSVNGFGSISHPEEFDIALQKRFLKTGYPRNLTIYEVTGQGVFNPKEMFDRLAIDGLIRRVFSGHFASMPGIAKMVADGRIEGYNFPQGVMSHLLRASAGRKPGIISKIGLHTFVDPRWGGGRLNEISKETWVKLFKIDNKEYLFYSMPALDFGVIRGTTADPEGNITMEKEALILDAMALVEAVRANGGTAIAQVERISSSPANPHDVVVPGLFLDAVYVCPNQKLCFIEKYNPTYTGEKRIKDEEIPKALEEIEALNGKAGKRRNLVHYIIARRASKEVRKGNVCNFGIGIPEIVSSLLDRKAMELIFTVEAGVIGGMPSRGISFGAGINPSAIIDQGSQFDFYDGGNLDISFLGALEIDESGSVNVSQVGNKIAGVGGFINLTQSAKRLVFCFPFTAKGLDVTFENGKLKILSEGKIPKFRKEVQQVSFNGNYAHKRGQEVIYVTERCVFKLEKGRLTLIEVAPGIDVEKDIFAKMPFRPQVAENIKIMDAEFFENYKN